MCISASAVLSFGGALRPIVFCGAPKSLYKAQDLSDRFVVVPWDVMPGGFASSACDKTALMSTVCVCVCVGAYGVEMKYD